MKHATDLTDRRIIRVFDMLDKGCRGFIVFEEFYVVICLMVAAFNKLEKKFILRHAKMCFTLMDEDFSGSISATEFTDVGFLWNLEGESKNNAQVHEKCHLKVVFCASSAFNSESNFEHLQRVRRKRGRRN